MSFSSSYQVVDEVGEGPDHRNADERYAEQYYVQEADAKHIGEPYTPAVHHSRVWIDLTVRRAHVHPRAAEGHSELLRTYCQTQETRVDAHMGLNYITFTDIQTHTL